MASVLLTSLLASAPAADPIRIRNTESRVSELRELSEAADLSAAVEQQLFDAAQAGDVRQLARILDIVLALAEIDATPVQDAMDLDMEDGETPIGDLYVSALEMATTMLDLAQVAEFWPYLVRRAHTIGRLAQGTASIALLRLARGVLLRLNPELSSADAELAGCVLDVLAVTKGFAHPSRVNKRGRRREVVDDEFRPSTPDARKWDSAGKDKPQLSPAAANELLGNLDHFDTTEKLWEFFNAFLAAVRTHPTLDGEQSPPPTTPKNATPSNRAPSSGAPSNAAALDGVSPDGEQAAHDKPESDRSQPEAIGSLRPREGVTWENISSASLNFLMIEAYIAAQLVLCGHDDSPRGKVAQQFADSVLKLNIVDNIKKPIQVNLAPVEVQWKQWKQQDGCMRVERELQLPLSPEEEPVDAANRAAAQKFAEPLPSLSGAIGNAELTTLLATPYGTDVFTIAADRGPLISALAAERDAVAEGPEHDAAEFKLLRAQPSAHRLAQFADLPHAEHPGLAELEAKLARPRDATPEPGAAAGQAQEPAAKRPRISYDDAPPGRGTEPLPY